MSNSTVTTSSISSSAQTTIPSSTEDITSSVASSISSEISSSQEAESSTERESATDVISTSTAPSADPTTQILTSIVTQSPSSVGESATPVTVVITTTSEPTSVSTPDEPTSTTNSAEAAAASSSAAALANDGSNNNNGGGSKGLDTGAKTAIAVVIPVVGIALILLAALFFWRKRKAKKIAEEQRRKEVEDYGFNPNNDPTLPAVGSEAGGPEMSEDHSSGYRGWGAATASHRKGSTTMSGGHTQGQLSETGSNPFTGSSPSGTTAAETPHMRDTMSSDELGALGAAPVAGTAAAAGNMRRGPSNASSRYSNGAHSDGSGPEDHMTRGGAGQSYDYGYGQAGPYGDGSYGGAASDMPIVRDVSARRNTRIQQASGPYQQGNSGIAQNF